VTTNIRINSDRLWDSLMLLDKMAATEKGGVKRLALTDLSPLKEMPLTSLSCFLTSVSDLKPLSLNRFDQVEIFVAFYLAQHDISYFDLLGINRFYRTKLSGFNLAGHRIAARPK